MRVDIAGTESVELDLSSPHEAPTKAINMRLQNRKE